MRNNTECVRNRTEQAVKRYFATLTKAAAAVNSLLNRTTRKAAKAAVSTALVFLLFFVYCFLKGREASAHVLKKTASQFSVLSKHAVCAWRELRTEFLTAVGGTAEHIAQEAPADVQIVCQKVPQKRVRHSHVPKLRGRVLAPLTAMCTTLLFSFGLPLYAGAYNGSVNSPATPGYAVQSFPAAVPAADGIEVSTYAELNNAINNASTTAGAPTNIIVTQNITLPSGGNFDLTGKHVRISGKTAGIMLDKPSGNTGVIFTLKDGSSLAVANLTISHNHDYFTSYIVQMKSETDGSKSSVTLESGAVFNVNGKGIAVEAAYVSGPTVTLNAGSKLLGNGKADKGIKLKTDGHVVINGGEILGFKNRAVAFETGGSGSFTMKGGTIDKSGSGAAVDLYNCTTLIEGGLIASGSTGAHALYQEGGTLVMKGGVVGGTLGETPETTTVSQCGLSLSNVTAAMEGGVITQNAGGVYLSEGSTFTLTNGKITGNSGSSGAGIFVSVGSSLLMQGGEISGNNAGPYSSGGGVHLASSDNEADGGKLTMTGGKIFGNTATKGGGVYVGSSYTSPRSPAVFTMKGGEISGNTANGTSTYSSGGGGVFVNRDTRSGIFNLESGTISGNLSTLNGGGIQADGTVNLSGGTVTGNQAKLEGGGIYTATDYALAVSGSPVVSGNTNSETGKASNIGFKNNYYLAVSGALTNAQLNLDKPAGLTASVKVLEGRNGYTIAAADLKAFGAPEDCGLFLKSGEIYMVANPGFLTGTIKDVNGGSLSGAVITIKQGGTELATVTVSEDGSFTIPLPAGTYQNVTLEFTLNGETEAVYSADTLVVTAGQTVSIDNAIPVGGVTASGTVSDVNTGAVDGATVTMKDKDGNVLGTTMTDETGSYEIVHLPDGTHTVVITVNSITETGIIKVENGAVTGSADLNIGGAAVTGKVTDANGNSVGGATVTIEKNGVVIGTGTTGADGTYKIKNLADGGYTIVVTTADGKAGASALKIDGSDISGKNVVLTAPSGTVTALRPDGRPANGAEISLSGIDNSNEYTGTVGANGTIGISTAEDGHYKVTITYGGITYETELIIRNNQIISGNSIIKIPGYTMNGKVEFENGNVPENAEVVITGPGGVEWGKAEIGKDGSFTINNIPAGGSSLTITIIDKENPANNQTITGTVTVDQNGAVTFVPTGGGTLEGGVITAEKPQDVKDLEDAIGALPPSNTSDTDVENARGGIGGAKELYDNLTQNQKDQIDAGTLGKLDQLIKRAASLKTQVDDSKAGVKVEVPNLDSLMGLVVSKEEITALDTASVTIQMSVERKGPDEIGADRNAVETVLGGMKAIGVYFDVILEKIVTKTGGGTVSTLIGQAPANIRMTIEIPLAMRGGSNYVIVRVHNGVAEILPAILDGNTLTFETDRFSTYAIAYEPAAPEQPETPESNTTTPPKTGGNSSPTALVVLLVLAAGGMFFLRKRAH